MITLRYSGSEADELALIAAIAINNGWTVHAEVSQFEFAQIIILKAMKELATQEAGEELTLDVVPVPPDVI